MFVKSARFYDAIYGFKDYAGSARSIRAFVSARLPEASSLLDVACGTGLHLAVLEEWYEVEGLDLSADLLRTAAARCPGARFHEADMAEFRVDRKFDVVTCLFSSVAYVRARERLDSAVACMARSLAPGGLLLVEPWFTPENYWVGHFAANYVDQPDLKISWMYTSALRQDLSFLDIHFQVGTPEGIHQFREEHELGLFTADEYEDAFRSAGLEPVYDEKGFFGRGLYWAQAPAG